MPLRRYMHLPDILTRLPDRNLLIDPLPLTPPLPPHEHGDSHAEHDYQEEGEEGEDEGVVGG